MSQETTYAAAYSPPARRFHWWTVALVAIQVPLGIYMAYRGNGLNIWDGLTNVLYDSHKALGLIILALVVARLIYRIVHGAPPDEPTLTWWQKGASHLTHWSLYLLLILVPLVGWVGISAFDARGLFGIVTIPGLVAKGALDPVTVFNLHKALAILIVALVAMHVGAAVVLHYFIRGDGVLARMLPAVGIRGRR